jgi:hypothetical protein
MRRAAPARPLAAALAGAQMQPILLGGLKNEEK